MPYFFLDKTCMQVEHLTVFVFIKTRENIKDTLVGRLAKQQRTNNIKQRSVEIQISVRLALVALTACQLTPYGPIALVIHSTWCVVYHCTAVFIFSQQTQPSMHKHLHFVSLSYIRIVGSTSYIFVLCFKDSQVQLEKSACEEGRII